MKARDWTEEYIYGLAVQEYDDIEFKASPLIDLSSSEGKMKVLDSLAKEISALANYGGGFLVLGVKDPKECKNGSLEIVHGGIQGVYKTQFNRQSRHCRMASSEHCKYD